MTFNMFISIFTGEKLPRVAQETISSKESYTWTLQPKYRKREKYWHNHHPHHEKLWNYHYQGKLNIEGKALEKVPLKQVYIYGHVWIKCLISPVKKNYHVSATAKQKKQSVKLNLQSFPLPPNGRCLAKVKIVPMGLGEGEDIKKYMYIH